MHALQCQETAHEERRAGREHDRAVHQLPDVKWPGFGDHHVVVVGAEERRGYQSAL